jgi:hypothetical protein
MIENERQIDIYAELADKIHHGLNTGWHHCGTPENCPYVKTTARLVQEFVEKLYFDKLFGEHKG